MHPNKTNLISPSYINSQKYDDYIKYILKDTSFIASQCLQQTLKKPDENYKSFFELIKDPELRKKIQSKNTILFEKY